VADGDAEPRGDLIDGEQVGRLVNVGDHGYDRAPRTSWITTRITTPRGPAMCPIRVRTSSITARMSAERVAGVSRAATL
jgi:hypothetical protein